MSAKRRKAAAAAAAAAAASAPATQTAISDAAARLADELAAARAAGRSAGEDALSARGYRRRADGDWCGVVRLPDGAGDVPVRVRLPERFPDALPVVLVDRPADAAERHFAHVDRDAAVCIAPTSNLLLDVDRPADLVNDALDRVAAELARGATRRSAPDLQEEFLAYWLPPGAPTVDALCDADGAARVLALARRGGAGRDGRWLLANSMAAAEAWAAGLGAKLSELGEAFFVPLSTSFDPPHFEDRLTLRAALGIVNQHAESADSAALWAWMQRTPLPATVVLSLPEPAPAAGRPLIAWRVQKPVGKELKARATAGFRPAHAPPGLALLALAEQPVQRLNLDRVDAGFILARGGGVGTLMTRRVAVVGAGALGSAIAELLASAGVGRIDIIDHDHLATENVHRHVLGMRDRGRPKTAALRDLLRGRFPHLTIEAHESRLEDVLATDATILLEADLIVLATGEETLERRANRLLRAGPPRVHAWLEPLGLAGHAFACGLAAGVGAGAGATALRACYECLFVRDPIAGLRNRAALTEAGQTFRRSLAGCTGTFTPFSALDARRTALEAADLALAILHGTVTGTTLVTWRGERTEPAEMPFALSRRADVIVPGSRERLDANTLARAECPVCGARADVSAAVSGSGPPARAPEAVSEDSAA